MNPTGKGGFQKGQSGNPHGRKKRIEEDDRLAIFKSVITDKEFKKLSELVLDKSKRGDYRYIKLAFEYLLGPPQQKVDITSKGEALQVIFKYEGEKDGWPLGHHSRP